jgi:hypothetical protein
MKVGQVERVRNINVSYVKFIVEKEDELILNIIINILNLGVLYFNVVILYNMSNESNRVWSGQPNYPDGNYGNPTFVDVVGYNAAGKPGYNVGNKAYYNDPHQGSIMGKAFGPKRGGGRGKSRHSTRNRRHLKKHKRVRHTRRKQSRRHRHSRRRHHR